MSDNGQQAPLIERLRRVPAIARVLEHTPNPLGYDTASIPVGALCREAADRIAELEAELAAERGRREDIRANERLALREKLICAALTGMLANHNIYGAPDNLADYAIKQADAVLAALDKEAAK